LELRAVRVIFSAGFLHPGHPVRVLLLSHAYTDPARRGKPQALARLGHTVTLAVPAEWPGPDGGPPARVPHSDDGRIRVVPVPVSGEPGDPAETRWSRRALRRLLTDFRPDLVQVEEEPGTPGAAVGAAAAHALRIPAVLYVRESVEGSRPLAERFRRRRTLRRAAGLAGATRLALGLAGRHAGAVPALVLPQFGVTAPLDAAREPHDDFVIGFVGRLVPERGLDLLFRACVRLLGPWRVVVAGSGPAQADLETLAERLGIAARVTWLGAIRPEALAPRWAGFDCVVVPPRSTSEWVETTGAVPLEAMARGVAVVGTRSGIVPELVEGTGIVVPEEDPEALAAAIQELVDDPARRAELAAAGRRRILADYTDDAVARRTAMFWDAVRSAAGAGGG
jgi:glycosyltransferase involved in cell wall biosynthesis